jgi:DMSO/TMAO reductase YedYZ molybdopterin-dependent catalytic subunit
MALTRGDDSYSEGRRELLERAAFIGLALVAGGFSLRAIIRGVSSLSPARVFRRPGQMPPEVTPNDEFYEISRNIVNPVVDVSGWTLKISGRPDSPYSLTYEELEEMPWVEEYVTLTCISNLVGGDLISNALWRGVRLKLLLEQAGVPESTERIAFHAADGYVDSFPMGYALRENVIVAYRMNGEPLPVGHGFPARIIVPGLYGMENVKWLTRIEPVPADFRGFWQHRGWADTAVINTMSRIDVPAANAGVAPVEMEIGGIAFAGDRGIDFVDFSTDGGETWQRAESSDPLSPYAWVLWRATWVPPETGRVWITVRATDGDGTTQTADIRGNLPDGATGHHRISVVPS